MAIKAPAFIKDPVATPRGWTNKKGELLKAQKLTQAECDEFNGVAAKPAPKPIEDVPVATEEKPKAKRKPRKKAAPKKKGLIASAISKIKGE